MKKDIYVKDAVAQRFEKICAQRKIKPNTLANISGVTPSTVYSMLEPTRRHVDIGVIKKLCDGLDISLKEFFDDKIFDDLEDELH